MRLDMVSWHLRRSGWETSGVQDIESLPVSARADVALFVAEDLNSAALADAIGRLRRFQPSMTIVVLIDRPENPLFDGAILTDEASWQSTLGRLRTKLMP